MSPWYDLLPALSKETSRAPEEAYLPTSTTTGGAGGSLVFCTLPLPSLRPLLSLRRLPEDSGHAPNQTEALRTSVRMFNPLFTPCDALNTACKRK